MFDLGLDSKLRACDLVKIRVRDICHGDRVTPRAAVMQQKTSRPVQFEITHRPNAKACLVTMNASPAEYCWLPSHVTNQLKCSDEVPPIARTRASAIS